MERPKVGVGVLLINSEGKVLVGKRKGSHAPYYSIPGGHLEMGETFEKVAIKEVLAQTGMTIIDPKVFCVSNNLETYEKEGVHFVSVNLWTRQFEGQPTVMEQEKCDGWQWVDPSQLPEPHFDASRNAIHCFLEKSFYLFSQD